MHIHVHMHIHIYIYWTGFVSKWKNFGGAECGMLVIGLAVVTLLFEETTVLKLWYISD